MQTKMTEEMEIDWTSKSVNEAIEWMKKNYYAPNQADVVARMAENGVTPRVLHNMGPEKLERLLDNEFVVDDIYTMLHKDDRSRTPAMFEAGYTEQKTNDGEDGSSGGFESQSPLTDSGRDFLTLVSSGGSATNDNNNNKNEAGQDGSIASATFGIICWATFAVVFIMWFTQTAEGENFVGWHPTTMVIAKAVFWVLTCLGIECWKNITEMLPESVALVLMALKKQMTFTIWYAGGVEFVMVGLTLVASFRPPKSTEGYVLRCCFLGPSMFIFLWVIRVSCLRLKASQFRGADWSYLLVTGACILSWVFATAKVGFIKFSQNPALFVCILVGRAVVVFGLFFLGSFRMVKLLRWVRELQDPPTNVDVELTYAAEASFFICFLALVSLLVDIYAEVCCLIMVAHGAYIYSNMVKFPDWCDLTVFGWSLVGFGSFYFLLGWPIFGLSVGKALLGVGACAGIAVDMAVVVSFSFH